MKFVFVVCMVLIQTLILEAKTLNTFPVKYDSFFGVKELNDLLKKELKWTPYIQTGNELVIYGYKSKFNIQIKDGQEVSEPLYKINFSLAAIGTSKYGHITLLKDEQSAKFKIQGVSPMSKEASEFLKTNLQGKDWADRTLTIWKIHQKLPGSILSEDEKKLFCMWKLFNGVIASQIIDYHKDFFENLACP